MKVLAALSRGMLILGGLMILAGVAWGIWVRVNQPPEPVITEAGAVVLAVTADMLPTTGPGEATVLPATPPPTLSDPAHSQGPTPALLPDWTAIPEAAEPAPTRPAATRAALTATPTPTPTSPPPAQVPPSRIVAPAIDLDAKVVAMGWEMIDHNGTMRSEWVVPEKAAGWHLNSALPGHNDNVVLSGHHNIGGKVFRYVVDLEPGDEITLYSGDTPYLYIVSEKYILKEAGMPLSVRQKNAQWIMPSGDERLTLVTCWPYEWPGNSHRVIVVGRPPSHFAEMGQEARDSGAE